MERALEHAERQVRELEARVAYQRNLAAKLTRHGFKGAAAQVQGLLNTLQGRLGRGKETAAAMRTAAR